jgi:hypothetical protein
MLHTRSSLAVAKFSALKTCKISGLINWCFLFVKYVQAQKFWSKHLCTSAHLLYCGSVCQSGLRDVLARLQTGGADWESADCNLKQV